MIIASERNCRRISRRIAPSERRMPISDLRSLTAISIMFMMNTPLTASVMHATKIMASFNAKRIRFAMAKTLASVSTR